MSQTHADEHKRTGWQKQKNWKHNNSNSVKSNQYDSATGNLECNNSSRSVALPEHVHVAVMQAGQSSIWVEKRRPMMKCPTPRAASGWENAR
jgi:hypothetical protein